MTEPLTFIEDFADIHIGIALIHKPTADNCLLTSFHINDISVQLGVPAALPGDQGLMWSLGWWKPGSKFDAAWSFQSRAARSPELLVACVPNNKLTKLIRLQQYMVKPYSTYQGSGVVLVPDRI